MIFILYFCIGKPLH